ncbi:MAG: hypothetical protein ABIF77_09815 [bacterium]
MVNRSPCHHPYRSRQANSPNHGIPRTACTTLAMLGWVVLLIFAGPLHGQEPESDLTAITIIYQGDIQGAIDECDCKYTPRGGLARRVTYLHSVWDEEVPFLHLDAGSIMGVPGQLSAIQSQFLCRETESLGLDAIGLGTWDLNYGLEFLQSVRAAYHLPFTCANVRRLGASEPLLPPYLVVERAGISFGICSVVMPNHEKLSRSKQLDNLVMEDPLVALRRVLTDLRPQVQVVVLLSQLGRTATNELLEQVDGIDIAIVGNSRTCYRDEKYVGDTLLLGAVFEGRCIGRADLRFGPDGSFQVDRIEVSQLTARYPDDPDTAAKVAEFKQKLHGGR